MKKILMIIMALTLVGCGSTDSRSVTTTQNAVEQLMEIDVMATTTAATTTVAETTTQSTTAEITAESSDVDIDLTIMSSDMVYAIVYQMMTEPEAYLGKTVRMNGSHVLAYYSVTDLYYHYCIIADATACCSQGLEFTLQDEYEYPENNADVTIVGTFGTYDELGITYYQLEDAKTE